MNKVLLAAAALLIAVPALAKDERRPEAMLAEAYDRLKGHPEEAAFLLRGENILTWHNEFWRPERWFSRSLTNWIGRYDKCQGELDIWDRGELAEFRRGAWTLRPDVSKTEIVIAQAKPARETGVVGQRTLMDYRQQPRRPLTTTTAEVEVEFKRPYDERTFYFVREKAGWRIDKVLGRRHCLDCGGRGYDGYWTPNDKRLKAACAEMAAGPAPSKNERRPEVMLVEAYDRLEHHPGEKNDAFWRPERWFSRDFRDWIARYEKCGGGAEIWMEGERAPAIRDVAIGSAFAVPKGMVEGSYPVSDYRANRRLSRLNKEAASASVEFTYQNRYDQNWLTETRRNRRETRAFQFVREDGEWRIDGVSQGIGGPGAPSFPSDSALTKACGPRSQPDSEEAKP